MNKDLLITGIKPTEAVNDMIIRTATPEDIIQMIDWAAAEGWNPGLNDAHCYQLADPNGFFVGMIDDQMVACISAVRYQGFGFIGFYMVKPEYRGRGLGMHIWYHAMEYLSGCQIGLDGVVAQRKNYEKSGFRMAHKSIRYAWQHQSIADAVAMKPPADHNEDTLLSYLDDFFPASRHAFNSAWRSQDNAKEFLVSEAGKIKGYGVIRACLEGYKIGPLFASDLATAQCILEQLTIELTDGCQVFLDVPKVNKKAVQLVTQMGAEPVFETVRMYIGGAPRIHVYNTYGITSFEIG
ncbi:GNAT family N-acetyltransferase [Marinicella sediminis]|uniref:GNAT family N-acetyltransferase n=1 Tax=Marinicella sediminis TaxID=1792834 RepID=A0ABV7JKH8_9GAMM|nr:GNAT family N-acetyltransferase [Marinicella sediminis]